MTVPDRYKFRYRLLASADIIGSTAFKSGEASLRRNWAHVFSGFFDEFPKTLAAKFEALDDRLIPNSKPPCCMELWKLVGDEILLVTESRRHEEAAYHALALKDALNEYSERLSKKHPSLGLKGTIWGAGFPVLNVQVQTQASADGRTALDFLGPSVDLGFRLAATADRRRIPISADVALFLTRARQNSSKAAKRLHIFADPPQVLKGINAGGPYPMLWLDRLDGEATSEDKLLHRTRDCQSDVLLEYLDDQFENASVGLTRPFIEGDPSEHFRSIPHDFIEWRKRLIADDPDLQYEADAGRPNPKRAGTAVPPLPAAPRARNAPHSKPTRRRKAQRRTR